MFQDISSMLVTSRVELLFHDIILLNLSKKHKFWKKNNASKLTKQTKQRK